MLTLARFMARPREFERRRAAAVRAFTPQKFRQEWELFWELLDPIFDGFEKKTAVRGNTECVGEGGPVALVGGWQGNVVCMTILFFS